MDRDTTSELKKASGLLARPLLASTSPDALVLRTAAQAASCLPALDVRNRYGKFRPTSAFTLVEVLVACAVLAIVVVLVAQMVSSATSVTGASRKRMDADDEARMVFDRMAGDFAQMLRRTDIDPLLLASNGNDEFYFYAQAPASSTYTNSSNSQIALIGYKVLTNGLARLGIEQSWDSLSFSASNMSTLVSNEIAASDSASTATNYHVIAPSVFRMEFAVLMKPGSTNNPGLTNGITNATAYPATSTNVTTNGANVFFQTNNAGQGLKDVEAIVVALGILDPTSQQIVTGAGLTNLMTDPNIMKDAITYPSNSSGLLTNSGTNGIPTALWKTTVLTTTIPGVPQAARAQIRIYQRTFPIAP